MNEKPVEYRDSERLRTFLNVATAGRLDEYLTLENNFDNFQDVDVVADAFIGQIFDDNEAGFVADYLLGMSTIALREKYPELQPSTATSWQPRNRVTVFGKEVANRLDIATLVSDESIREAEPWTGKNLVEKANKLFETNRTTHDEHTRILALIHGEDVELRQKLLTQLGNHVAGIADSIDIKNGANFKRQSLMVRAVPAFAKVCGSEGTIIDWLVKINKKNSNPAVADYLAREIEKGLCSELQTLFGRA